LKLLSKIFDRLASLELAVFLILTLAVVLSVGTVYESKYSAAVASQLVYRSWWMQVLLWLFIFNVTAAALSRLPWKKHHVGFLITHLGIIILLLGSWIQQQRGVDGILALAPGESGRQVKLEENRLNVFRTIPGKTYELELDERLDYDLRRPFKGEEKFALQNGETLRLLQYYPKATRDVSAKDVKEGLGVPALKFQLNGSRATFRDWMFLQTDTGSRNSVGPAEVRFVLGTPDLSQKPEKPTLFFFLENNPKNPPKIAVARSGQPYQVLGQAEIGKNVPLGWMDFSLIVESYHPSAVPEATYAPMTTPIPGFPGYQVVEVELGGEKLWLELGASGQITHQDSMYYIQFNRKMVDLGFELKLQKFEIGFYEGTTRPKSYSSLVEVAGATHLISMNEPLHHGGFTFYQASYEMDDAGQPALSVLSVNYDPGRWIKYFGSLMMTIGILSMFYFKPKYSGSHKLLKKEANV
jgi:hypothetical protein